MNDTGNEASEVKSLSVIKKSTLVEKIVSALIDFIKVSGLNPSDRLPPEAKLAEMFGVSRLAIREALIKLRALGLVEAKQGSGWFLREFKPADTFRTLSPLLKSFTDSDLSQVMMVRLILEPSIAKLAANNISPKGLRKLKEDLDCMEASISDRDRFIECDMDFHSTLAEQSKNKILAVLSAILTDLSRTVQQAYRNTDEDRQLSVKFHREIFEAIKVGDADEAEELMTEHIDDVWSRIE